MLGSTNHTDAQSWLFLTPLYMTTITHSFRNMRELERTLASGDIARDVRGSCYIEIGRVTYYVHFKHRVVEEIANDSRASCSFWGRLKELFTSCCGRQRTVTKRMKKLLFTVGEHFTDPPVAEWVLMEQMRREGVVPGIYFRDVKAPKHCLRTFRYQGEGASAKVSSVMVGCGAGPILIRKQPKPEFVSSALAREAELLSRLKHPNIITCWPKLMPDGSMVMGNGGLDMFTLCDGLGQHWPKDFFLSCCRQLFEGLVYLARENIVHRDIKLENVMVTANTGHLSLIDFGLAKALGPLGSSKDKTGTHAYMAPEVFYRHRYRTSPDVFSAGCMIYTILTNMMLRTSVEVEQGVYYDEAALRLMLAETMVNLPGFSPAECQEWIELLVQMLECDPSKRITPDEILGIFNDRIIGRAV